MTQRVIFSGGCVVLPNALVDSGSVIVEGDHIAAINQRTYPEATGPEEHVIDTSGRVVMPGLVDLHNDALELEINPRPKTDFPLPLALQTADRRLASSGVTTELHAVFFANYDRKERRLEDAPARVQAVHAYAASGDALVDHRVLYRADLWSHASLDHIMASSEGVERPVISLNDHTPGQGQYRDAEGLKLYLQQVIGQSAEEADRNIAREIARAQEQPNIALEMLSRIRELGVQRSIVVVSHDDDSPERVDQMHAAGARIGEFPINVAAARRQRELGMVIVMGAPNVVRGGSSSGNISAAELIARELVDVLCADYFSPAMLVAVKQLVDAGTLSLPQAAAMVTWKAAAAIGRSDQIGSILPGARADLLVVDFRGPLPHPEYVLRGGEIVWRTRPSTECSASGLVMASASVSAPETPARMTGRQC